MGDILSSSHRINLLRAGSVAADFGRSRWLPLFLGHERSGSARQQRNWTVTTWLGLATAVKRWHDLGETAWNAIWHCIPGVNVLMFLYFEFKNGNDGPNAYGERPQEIDLL